MAADLLKNGGIIIRSFIEGDEKALIHLYNETFRRNRTLEHWKWKYERNPYFSEPICTIAFSEDEQEIVGQYTVIPLRINFLGKPLLGCQFTDTMINPQFRSAGLYIKTATACYDKCINRGFTVAYGFPNRSAYPGFMRRLNGKKVTHFNQYIARIGIADSIRKFVRVRLAARCLSAAYDWVAHLTIQAKCILLKRQMNKPQELTFRVSNHIGDKYQSLWNAIRSYEVLSIWKDTGYLRWRYEKNPDHTFDYFSLEAGDRLVAFAVAHSSEQTVIICELQVKDKDIPVGRYFVNKIKEHFIGKRRTVLTFIGHDGGYYRHVFKDFKESPYFRYRFCGKVLDKEHRLSDFFPFPHNWNITYGDIDNL